MGAWSGKYEKTYELSHHLIDQKIVTDGVQYSFKVEKIIESITKFEQQVMQDKLALYLAKKFDHWFLEQEKKEQKKNIDELFNLKNLNLTQQKKTKKKSVVFSQLQDKDSLKQFILKTELLYIMSVRMNDIVAQFPQTMDGIKKFYQNSNTIRKQQQNIGVLLNNQKQFRRILQGLVGNYYLKVLQKQGHIDDVTLTAYLEQFHSICGIPLMKFMLKQILSSKQLLTILYELLLIFSKSSLIQKQQIPKLIKQHFQNIHQAFKFRLVQQQFTYTVPKQQLLNLRYIANCYNSDLYRYSLNEIQNPQIEQDPQTWIKNVNTFPVHTVKESYKKN